MRRSGRDKFPSAAGWSKPRRQSRPRVPQSTRRRCPPLLPAVLAPWLAKTAANPASACGSSAAADRSGWPSALNCRSGAFDERSRKRSGHQGCQPSAHVRQRYRRHLRGVRRLRCRQSKPLRFSWFSKEQPCLADRAPLKQRRPTSFAVKEERKPAWSRRGVTQGSDHPSERDKTRLALLAGSKNQVRAADLRSILDPTIGPGHAAQN